MAEPEKKKASKWSNLMIASFVIVGVELIFVALILVAVILGFMAGKMMVMVGLIFALLNAICVTSLLNGTHTQKPSLILAYVLWKPLEICILFSSMVAVPILMKQALDKEILNQVGHWNEQRVADEKQSLKSLTIGVLFASAVYLLLSLIFIWVTARAYKAAVKSRSKISAVEATPMSVLEAPRPPVADEMNLPVPVQEAEQQSKRSEADVETTTTRI